jgi:hypothetical protein
MNDWFNDLFKLISAIFGITKDITEDSIKQLARLSVWVIVIIVCLVFLSGITGYSSFLTLGAVFFSFLCLFLVIAAQPLFVVGEQLDKLPVFSRIFNRIGIALVVLAAFVITSFNVSAGSDGVSQLALFLMMVTGLMLISTRYLKQQLGIKLICLSIILAAASYFPLTAANFSLIREIIDIDISSKLVPPAKEYEFSLDKFDSYDAGESRFFVHGKPILWCREDVNRVWGYRCFDQPGRDQTTNAELVPISEEIVKTIKYRLLQAKTRTEAELAAEQSVAAHQAEQERISKINEEKSAYIKKYVLAGSNKAEMATSFKNGTTQDIELSHQLRMVFKKPVKSEFLNQQALTDGVFDRLFQGDKSEFEKLKLIGLANRIMLGEVTQMISGNKGIPGASDAKISVQVRLLDTSTGEVINSSLISKESVGYSESEAISKAKSQAVKAIIEQFEL